VRIGTAEAGPGERAFGYIEVGHTTSYIPIHIPVNILRGPVDGPTLLVDAALHGPEIIGILGIGKLDAHCGAGGQYLCFRVGAA
jgi:predicted deacylase